MKNEYWNQQVEEAILLYQLNKNDKLFTTTIYPAFTKLIKGVISGCHFNLKYYKEKDLICDVVTMLWQRIDKYNSELSSSFTFFTNVTKNLLINQYKFEERNRKFISIEEFLDEEII